MRIYCGITAAYVRNSFLQDLSKKLLIRSMLRQCGLVAASDGSTVIPGTSGKRFENMVAMLLPVEFVELLPLIKIKLN